jgi:carbon storage regulator
MLLSKRKEGETLLIGENIELRIVSVHKKKVILGIIAPRDVKITATKLSDAAMANTMAAANSINIREFMHTCLRKNDPPLVLGLNAGVKFDALSDSDIASSLKSIESSTTSIGGPQQTFSSITDPAQGTVAEQEATMLISLTGQTQKNAQLQQREQVLNQQLQAADSCLAELAAQQSILTAVLSKDRTAAAITQRQVEQPT